MSIFSRIVSRIWTDIYPHVQDAVGKVEDAAVEVEDHVREAVQKARDVAEDLASVVTNSAVARAMQERILDCEAERRKAEPEGDDLTGWRASITDLLKLNNIDASFANRRMLAGELGISSYAGTAAQNTEMSKRVLAKLRGI